jgi:ferredoxin
VTRLEAPIVRVVLYEGPGSRALSNETRTIAVRSLLERGFPVSSIRTAEPAAVAPNGILLVLGDFEQEPPVSHPQVRFGRLSGTAAEAVGYADQVRKDFALETPGTWKPWFPVIDYSRCTNCMQCLSFCLLEVYGEGRQDRCTQSRQLKTVSACSRLSRGRHHVPVRMGLSAAMKSTAMIWREAMKVDISALLGSVYRCCDQRKGEVEVFERRDDDRL